ncbi:MAG TPA: nitrogen regulation protein NR(II) [Gammaproteobacteria bacterium]|nr:nitrogen regulation protein NR(II) [Gammaproteobacteria bacterium]
MPTTNAMHQRILDNLTHAVLMFDANLCLDFINPAGEMLFAVSAKRLIGQCAPALLPADSHLLEAIEKGRDSGHPFTEHEVQITLPGRRELTVDCTVIPLAAAGSDSGLLVELQQMDRQLRIAREGQQLAQQETLRSLVRGLAHEIKNPLGGLRGAAQLLERELPDPALKEYTNIIIGEADRLRNLVDTMLGPNALPQKEPVNIHQVLEHVRQLVSVEKSGDITFVSDYDPSIPEILGDRDQLVQAVLNIVGNAVQAIGKQGEIILRTRAQRQFTIGQTCHKLVCRVEIIDNGPGIPEDMLESIFFPMVTGRADGTGLGLSIAQSLINQHGGLIQCESRPGRTRFSLLLPLDQAGHRAGSPQRGAITEPHQPATLRHSA